MNENVTFYVFLYQNEFVHHYFKVDTLQPMKHEL